MVVSSCLGVYPTIDLLGKMKLICVLYIADPGPHKMSHFCIHNFKAGFKREAPEGVKKDLIDQGYGKKFDRQMEEYRSKEKDM